MGANPIIGIDLAGPGRPEETALALLTEGKVTVESGLADRAIVNTVQATGRTQVYIDAPLGYAERGGYRASDSALRKHLNDKGFMRIGIMAPTMSRMIYLTARGIRLSRWLASLPGVAVFETHPGAFLALDGYNYETVLAVKKDASARASILEEMRKRSGLAMPDKVASDHELMALACALCGEKHHLDAAHWNHPPGDADGFAFVA